MEKSLCPHFGACGGCSFLNVPYQEQLLQKEILVRNHTRPFAPKEIRPIIPSPQPYFYRNKMEFAFGCTTESEFSLGLRRKNSFWRIIDVEACRLLSELSNEILKFVRLWAKQSGISAFNRKNHKGALRYLVVREGKKTGNVLLNLITTYEIEKDTVHALANELKTRFPQITTLLWGRNSGKSDVAYAQDTEILLGDGFIEDIIGEVKFKISPSSFFQTNTLAAEKLYNVIKELAVASGSDSNLVLDLYCGAGGISLFIADKSKNIIGIESNPNALADAEINAQKNSINNVKFLRGETEKLLPQVLEENRSSSIIIVDPPRAGLHPKALKMLMEHKSQHIIYVSCNPKALEANLEILTKIYDVCLVQPLDLFPHTPHVETVVWLRGRSCKI